MEKVSIWTPDEESEIAPPANVPLNFLEPGCPVERFAHVVFDVAIRGELGQSQ